MGTQGVTRTRLADEREKKGLVDTPGRSRSLVLKVFVLIQLLKSGTFFLCFVFFYTQKQFVSQFANVL